MGLQTNKKITKPIAQEDPLGCAVACVAFVLSISYQDALKLFKDGERRVKNEANFYCKEIVQILNSQGLNYKCNYIKDKLRNRIYKGQLSLYKDPKSTLLAIIFVELKIVG